MGATAELSLTDSGKRGAIGDIGAAAALSTPVMSARVTTLARAKFENKLIMICLQTEVRPVALASHLGKLS